MINEIAKIRTLQNPKRNILKTPEKNQFVQEGVCKVKWKSPLLAITISLRLRYFYSTLKGSCFPFKIIFYVTSKEKLHLKMNVNNIIYNY